VAFLLELIKKRQIMEVVDLIAVKAFSNQGATYAVGDIVPCYKNHAEYLVTNKLAKYQDEPKIEKKVKG
jgi:hypothetical protein